ncbi:MAG: TPM domain-containing protein [Candidatus Krumholzibacteriia bacterium]
MTDREGGRSDVPNRYFTAEEQAQVRAAIEAAEARTSGEIRVHVERDLPRRGPAAGDAYRRARDVFARLGMHRTAEHNGVLIYLALRSRTLAVVGDEGLHAQVGDAFWQEVVAAMLPDFAADRPAAGLAAGAALIGERLRLHFPHRDDDVNELPDDISFAP